MGPNIHFSFQQSTGLNERTRLKAFIATEMKKAGRIVENIDIIFCTDQYLLNINKLYLKHNYFTDIITFDYSEGSSFINAEIYISVDRVKDNASVYGISMKEELHRVIFHGMLHLLGYKDKTANEKNSMRTKEDRWLKAYFK